MALMVPRYTVDDLERLPEDGNRYEILDGVLLVTPAPSSGHQIVANRIQTRLTAALEGTNLAHVVGPGAIAVPPRTQLQPDVLVYPACFVPGAEWATITEHWLAVEVLSRSSRVYDCEVKRAAYFALGVRQLWLADSRDRSIEIWRSPRVHHVERGAIRWRVPGSSLTITVDLTAVFAGF
ncbi:MAG TPA: Uma2 family endonuclease [Gemmatimonadaceae bacterium]|nr:Uma2 family endonuclease [Gemmatimonadaceae bacterium]